MNKSHEPTSTPRTQFAGPLLQLAHHRWATSIAAIAVAAYVFLLFVQPQPWMGSALTELMQSTRSTADSAILAILQYFGMPVPRTALARHGCFLLAFAGLVPWMIMAVVGRGRPRNLGLRTPNVFGWRILLIGYLLALPLQFWMVRGHDIGTYYLNQLRQTGGGTFYAYYLVNMTTEHFFFHGVMLAAFRRGWAWPEPPPVHGSAGTTLRRVLQWIGLAQPLDTRAGRAKKLVRWCGLPNGCIFAVVMSGFLFGAVHIGKDPRELILSVPGGMLLAFIAYRTNSLVIPLTLHLATAATAFALIHAVN